LVEQNLWGGNISEFNANWVFTSELHEIAIDNPDYASPEEVSQADAKVGAETLVYFHKLLKEGFWDGFKERVFIYQEHVNAPPSTPGPYDELLAMDKGFYLAEAFFDLNLPEKIKIFCTFEGGNIHFYPNPLESIRALHNLIEGVPVASFRKCRDKTCGKCFISTTHHKREFCNRLCAARHNQRMLRELTPRPTNNTIRHTIGKKCLAPVDNKHGQPPSLNRAVPDRAKNPDSYSNLPLKQLALSPPQFLGIAVLTLK